MTRVASACTFAVLTYLAVACSGGDPPGGGVYVPASGGSPASGAEGGATGSPMGVSAAMGMGGSSAATVTSGMGGSTATTTATTTTGSAGMGGSAVSSAGGSVGMAGAGGGEPGGLPVSELVLSTVVGNGTIGLEWPIIAGATGYNLYWSNEPGVTPATGQLIANVERGFIHRELQNDQPYYYVVTALMPDESAPSAEASGTPSGEWVLEQLGTGDFDDVITGARVPTVPIENRFHILLVAEGYTSDLLDSFHTHADHAATRNNDVDRWIDEVFQIEPYTLFPEAFVIWYLARPSAETLGGDTAFQVPVTVGGSISQMQNVSSTGETATRLWDALALLPYPPDDSGGGGGFGFGDIRNYVAAFIMYDPAFGSAGVSGLTTSMQSPAGTRIRTAFGMGHAHEFTHALSNLNDEYMETSNSPPGNWDETSNVVDTASCSELPWAHLIVGGAINPDVDGLIGAFGSEDRGFHSELLCLLNGTHDNGQYFGSSSGSCSASSCTLRVENRMCNFCREMTAFHIFARGGVLAEDDFETWKNEYRTPFYERFGLSVPEQVPQSNDVRNPANGEQIYQPCVQ